MGFKRSRVQISSPRLPQTPTASQDAVGECTRLRASRIPKRLCTRLYTHSGWDGWPPDLVTTDTVTLQGQIAQVIAFPTHGNARCRKATTGIGAGSTPATTLSSSASG